MPTRKAKASMAGFNRNAGKSSPRMPLGVGGAGNVVTPLGARRLQGAGRAERLASNVADQGNAIIGQPASPEVKYPCKG